MSDGVIDIDLSIGAGGLYASAPVGSLQRQTIEATLRLAMPVVMSTAARLEHSLPA